MEMVSARDISGEVYIDEESSTANISRMSPESIFTNQDLVAIFGKYIIAMKTIKTLIFFVNLGGVICFWGGIIFLGMLFMFALMTKNYLMKNCYKNKYDE